MPVCRLTVVGVVAFFGSDGGEFCLWSGLVCWLADPASPGRLGSRENVEFSVVYKGKRGSALSGFIVESNLCSTVTHLPSTPV